MMNVKKLLTLIVKLLCTVATAQLDDRINLMRDELIQVAIEEGLITSEESYKF